MTSVVCPRCNGRGILWLPEDADDDKVFKVPCPMCNGTGRTDSPFWVMVMTGKPIDEEE